MLHKISVIVSIFTVAICGPAMAEPIDPDPDGMSVYFDTEGTIYCLELDDWEPAAGAGPTVMAYLLVTRPDTPFPGIQAWEAHAEIYMNSLIPTWHFTLLPGAYMWGIEDNNYIVGCATAPIPITGDAVMIASAELNWLGTEGHAEATFILSGVEGSLGFPDGPGYAAEAGYPSPCQPLFGEWGEVAWINGGCQTIAGEDMTWGMVKSLY
jgi:hypothetical protein